MTHAVPTTPADHPGWNAVDGGKVFGPESETITPVASPGANTTAWSVQRGYRNTYMLKSTANQVVTVQIQGSDTAAFTDVYNVGSAVTMAAGNVTPTTTYITVTDALPFLRVNTIVPGAGTGTVKATAYGLGNKA